MMYFAGSCVRTEQGTAGYVIINAKVAPPCGDRGIVNDDRPAPHSRWLATTIHMSAHGSTIRIRLLQAVSVSSLDARKHRILLKALIPFRELSPVGR